MSQDILSDRQTMGAASRPIAPAAASLIAGMHGAAGRVSTLAVFAVGDATRFRARLEAAPPFAPTIILVGSCSDPVQGGGSPPCLLGAPLLVFGTGTTDAAGNLEIELEFRSGVPAGLHPHCQAVSVVPSLGADQGAVTSNTVAISG